MQDIPATIALSRTPTDLERIGDFSQTVTNASGQRPVIYMPGTNLSGNPVPVPGNIRVEFPKESGQRVNGYRGCSYAAGVTYPSEEWSLWLL